MTLDSPCLDAGDPCRVLRPEEWDADGQERIVGGRVDMGAYEVPPTLELLKDMGGQVITAGSRHTVRFRWHALARDRVHLYFTRDDCTEDFGCGYPYASLDEYELGDMGECEYPVRFPADVPVSNDVRLHLRGYKKFVDYDNFEFMSVESEPFVVQAYEAGAAVPSVWPQEGAGPQHTGRGPVRGPELGCVAWEGELPAEVLGGIVVGAEGRVHVAGADGVVYTYDPCGVLVWQYDVGGTLQNSPAVGPNGHVYAAGRDGVFHALDQNGNVCWTAGVGPVSGAGPLVGADGAVYVGTEAGELHCFDVTGTEQWVFRMPGLTDVLPGAIVGSPAQAPDGTVYVAGLFNSSVYALHPDDGAVIWEADLGGTVDPCDPCSSPDGPWFGTAPVVGADGTVYVMLLGEGTQKDAGHSSYESAWPALCALSPVDGSVLWEFWEDDVVVDDDDFRIDRYVSPVLTPGGDLLLMGEAPEYYYQHCEQFCEWDYERGWQHCWYECEIRCVHAKRMIVAVRPDGSCGWVRPLREPDVAAMAVGADGLIYVGADDYTLHVLSGEGDVLSWLDTMNITGPVVLGGAGRLYAIREGASMLALDSGCEGQPLALHRMTDLSMDGRTEMADFAEVSRCWGVVSESCDWYGWYGTCWPVEGVDECRWPNEDSRYLRADVDGDLRIGLTDLVIVCSRWLEED